MQLRILPTILLLALTARAALALPATRGASYLTRRSGNVDVRLPQLETPKRVRRGYLLQSNLKRDSDETNEEKAQNRSERRVGNDVERIDKHFQDGLKGIQDAASSSSSNNSNANDEIDQATDRIDRKFQSGLSRIKDDSVDDISSSIDDSQSKSDAIPFGGNRFGDAVIQSGICDKLTSTGCNALRTLAQTPP